MESGGSEEGSMDATGCWRLPRILLVVVAATVASLIPGLARAQQIGGTVTDSTGASCLV